MAYKTRRLTLRMRPHVVISCLGRGDIGICIAVLTSVNQMLQFVWTSHSGC